MAGTGGKFRRDLRSMIPARRSAVSRASSDPLRIPGKAGVGFVTSDGGIGVGIESPLTEISRTTSTVTVTDPYDSSFSVTYEQIDKLVMEDAAGNQFEFIFKNA